MPKSKTDPVQYQTTRIWKKTIRTLQQCKRLSGQNIVQILDRLASQELAFQKKSSNLLKPTGRGSRPKGDAIDA